MHTCGLLYLLAGVSLARSPLTSLIIEITHMSICQPHVSSNCKASWPRLHAFCSCSVYLPWLNVGRSHAILLFRLSFQSHMELPGDLGAPWWTLVFTAARRWVGDGVNWCTVSCFRRTCGVLYFMPYMTAAKPCLTLLRWFIQRVSCAAMSVTPHQVLVSLLRIRQGTGNFGHYTLPLWQMQSQLKFPEGAGGHGHLLSVCFAL